jgi:hypothetical protein
MNRGGRRLTKGKHNEISDKNEGYQRGKFDQRNGIK